MKGKTNAMRLLEQAKIPFSTVEYEVDESDLSGEHVAAQLNQPVEQVFKTLVVRGEKNGIMVCCIPVAEELDLKKVAILTKDKKVEKIWMPASVGTMYPLEKTPADKSKLVGFAWFDYIRPKDKNDIFVWRSKTADKMLKTTEKRVVPLQKLEDIK